MKIVVTPFVESAQIRLNGWHTEQEIGRYGFERGVEQSVFHAHFGVNAVVGIEYFVGELRVFRTVTFDFVGSIAYLDGLTCHRIRRILAVKIDALGLGIHWNGMQIVV